MKRLVIAVTAVLLLGAAPVQCGEPEPIRYARRDDPAETVWRLGVRLRERGHTAAALETWRFLIERYPSTRWAERARAELESADADAAPPTPAAAAPAPPPPAEAAR